MKMPTSRWGLLMGAFFALVVPLHAEVMDKEPSTSDNWILAVVTGVLAFAAWRWRRWAGCVVFALFALAVLNVWSELHDPSVGPAIVQEAGSSYAANFYASAAIGLVLHSTAAIWGLRRRRAYARRII